MAHWWEHFNLTYAAFKEHKILCRLTPQVSIILCNIITIINILYHLVLNVNYTF
jgi:hypothetical protein